MTLYRGHWRGPDQYWFSWVLPYRGIERQTYSSTSSQHLHATKQREVPGELILEPLQKCLHSSSEDAGVHNTSKLLHLWFGWLQNVIFWSKLLFFVENYSKSNQTYYGTSKPKRLAKMSKCRLYTRQTTAVCNRSPLLLIFPNIRLSKNSSVMQ